MSLLALPYYDQNSCIFIFSIMLIMYRLIIPHSMCFAKTKIEDRDIFHALSLCWLSVTNHAIRIILKPTDRRAEIVIPFRSYSHDNSHKAMRDLPQARYLYVGIASPSTRSKYSRSIKLSTHFLIIFTSGLKRWLNCEITSVKSC